MTTNKERLASIEKGIENIDKNIETIAKNNVSQWKIINKNAQDIASQKSVVGIMKLFIVGIIVSIGGLIWGKYR